MKTLKPQKRSVSPFGHFPTEEKDPLSDLKAAFETAFHDTPAPASQQLNMWNDARFVPSYLDAVWKAPANHAPQLDELCSYLVKYQHELEEEGLGALVFQTMENLFFLKTELFLVDHHEKELCEKMGWKEEYRDSVLFAKERDTLIGRFFAPVTEKSPGIFSEFINRWTESKTPDRILHLLDFLSGAKNPTFDHYLVFTHPALARLTRDKSLLLSFLETAKPLLQKLSSPTWESDTRKKLGLS